MSIRKLGDNERIRLLFYVAKPYSFDLNFAEVEITLFVALDEREKSGRKSV